MNEDSPAEWKYKRPCDSAFVRAYLNSDATPVSAEPIASSKEQAWTVVLEDSIRVLRKGVTASELKTLQRLLAVLVDHVDNLILQKSVSPAEWARAMQEDAVAEVVLREVHSRRSRPMTTAKSIREGKKFMARAKEAEAARTSVLIETGELITSGELQRRLQVNRQAVSRALKELRLFAVSSPTGESFYPAFCTEATLDRRSLGRVSKALGALPPLAKFDFFHQKSRRLQESALDALRKGRLAEVLAVAAEYAER
ncbi:hypothetical protein [Rhizobacter sp. Root404]|uniref:hypothetical protein n=1 Tax=Rhizobacter sp. Root404 TaxID=1736528 RepID=UPI0012F81CD6|nr:hypothetical protein [Rhizobacter sp. Root404]